MFNSLRALFLCGVTSGFYFLLQPCAMAASAIVVPTQDNVRYVGSTTCQSSMCHGGASPSRCQFTIWSQQDFHSRSYATLVTPRSTRMVESLGIASAMESNRCTVCHAPLAALPAAQLAPTAKATEGVSCEECHNPAESWLRGHTRPDWSYADRVHAGVRDLRDVKVRADTCVACHQVLDPAILKAGHPELIFELDGQSASEPRHWKDKDAWFGPKAWLVGQFAALTAISHEITLNGKSNQSNDLLLAQQQALFWLLGPYDEYPTTGTGWNQGLPMQEKATKWDPQWSFEDLQGLASRSNDFLDAKVPALEQALRAERLVMGLDRLSKSLDAAQSDKWQTALSVLFAAVQDRDKFDPKDFSSRLKQFADVVTTTK